MNPVNLQEPNDTKFVASGESEEIFRAIFENNSAAIAIIEADTTISMVNDAYCEMTGYSKKEVIGMSWKQQIPPGDLEKLKEYNRRRSANSEDVPTKYEFSFYKKDGEVRNGLISASMIQPSRKIITFIVDITERKQAEEALHQSESKFRSLFEYSPIGKSITDIDGTVHVNKSFCEMLGYSEEELIAKKWIELTHPDDIQESANYIQLLKDGKILQACYEKRFIHKNGNIIWTNLSSYLHRDKDGKQQFFNTTMVDVTERKKYENEIIRRQYEVQAIIDASIDVVTLVNEKGEFLKCNEKLAKRWGKSKEELIGHSAAEILPPPIFKNRLESIKRVIASGVSEQFVDQYEEKYYEVAISPVFEIDGSVINVALFSSDVTESVKDKEKLRKSEERMRKAQMIAHVGNWELDLKTKMMWASKEAARIYGFDETKDEFTLDEIQSLVIQDHQLSLNVSLHNLIASNNEYKEEFQIRRANNGEIRNIFSIAEVVRTSDGTPDKLIGVIQDITERKKNEEAIKTLQKAIEQNPTPTIITNSEGKIEFVNTQFTTFMQYSLDDIKGQNPRIFNPGHIPQDEFENMWTTLREGNIWRCEFKNRKKDKTEFLENVIISPLLADDGLISHYILITEDITEKKRMLNDLVIAKEKAEESDRLKSAFLANMSHEIRTPLNSIIGFSDLMLDPFFGTGEHSKFAHIIKENGNNLLNIISDIMDISKIEAGQILTKKRSCSVNQLINYLQKEYSFTAHAKGIELKLDPSNPKEEIVIQSDVERLKQILINFISNAIKFTETGCIEIGIKPAGKFVQFHVKDTGIGIPEEYHEKIFERFRQVESADKRKYGGNGLGLSISKSLVELLGGTIWIESEPEKGSTFYFTVPII